VLESEPKSDDLQKESTPTVKDLAADPKNRSAPSQPDFTVTVHGKAFDELYLGIAGKVHVDNAREVLKQLEGAINADPLRNVVVDLGEVNYFDSAGVAVLLEINRKSAQLNNAVKMVNVGPRIEGLLKLVDFEGQKATSILQPRDEPGILVQIGQGAEDLYANIRDILTFIGASVVALFQDLSRPGKVRWDGFLTLLARAGSDAVPIVTCLSFLMGAVLAFQAAIQLRKFGANIFVADLVSVSICLEMGPLMTAITVAGRSGAAFAAQIGTMKVTEEVDALQVMAIDPMRYLVSPRILAIAIICPCLTLFADMVGILGGCVVANLSLDLTPTTFFTQVTKVLEVSDVTKGLIKSFAFGIEIATIGCLRGFQVRGGAESVGWATTSTVVTSIFVIVATDAIFSMLYHYLDLL
jgi:phospholipid/cholesterol/gamma-HCH transport system permease protein